MTSNGDREQVGGGSQTRRPETEPSRRQDKGRDESESSTVLVRKHRRRGSTAGGNFLAQLATHVILLVILLALRLNHQPLGADALKLPSFLSSWMPQQHQQHQQHDDLSSEHSTNMLTFAGHFGDLGPRPNGPAVAPATGAGGQKQSMPRPAPQTHSPLKRPFQSMLAGGVGKHPAGHLFSVLPKSLFGRILAGNNNNNNHQAALKQQQPLQLMLANKLALTLQPNQVPWAHSAQQQQQQQQPFTLANYNGQGYRFPAAPTANQMAPVRANDARQLVAELMQPNQHPITSFKPTNSAMDQHARPQVPMEQEKKHALGYGEQDDDFVIMNAQQVPELQLGNNNGAGSVRGAAGEEYREIPAIVISDQEDLAHTNQVAESGKLAPSSNLNSTSDQLDASREEALKVSSVEQQNALNRTEPTTNQTQTDNSSDLTKLTLESNSTELDLATVQQAQASAEEARNNSIQLPADSSHSQRNLSDNQEAAPLASPAQNAVGQLAAADSPESNRQESAAKAVVVSSMSQPQQMLAESQHQDQAEEAIESFILGPYKGLTLQDELVPQTQMEFMDSQQLLNGMNQFRPPVRQPNGPGSNLIGSASNLIQQARQLIQMPFTHLPTGNHFHQIQQRPQQQQRGLFNYMAPPQAMAMRKPADSNAFRPQQHKWPTGMMQFQRPSYIATSGSQPQAMHTNFNGNHKQNPYAIANQNGHFLMGPAESSGFAMFSSQQHHFSGGNNQILRWPGSYMGDGLVNQMAPFGQHQHIEFGRVPSAQRQQQAASFQQVQLDLAGDNATESNGRRLHKSGLYQIEPPKLSESEQNKLTSGDEENLIGFRDMNQQKVEPVEQTSQELDEGQADSGSSGQKSGVEEDDADDDDPADNQDNRQRPLAAATEPILIENSRLNKSLSEPRQQQLAAANQILQVGASFGVAESGNRSQPVSTSGEMRKGQVFNEPLVAGLPKQQQQQPIEQIHQVDTRVFTLPYAVANSLDQFGHQLGNFGPPPHVPVYMRPNQAAGWQMAAQQPLPITFISTGSASAAPSRRPVGAGWSAPFGRSFRKQAAPQTRMMTSGLGSVQAEDERQARANELPTSGYEQQASKTRLQYFHYQPTTPAETTNADFSTAAAPDLSGKSLSGSEQSTTSSSYPSTEVASSTSSSTSTTPATIVVDSSQEAQISDDRQPSRSRQQQQQQQQSDEENSDSGPQGTKGKQQPSQARSPSSFCSGRPAGLYADVEQRCKAYYQCAPTGHQMFRCNNQTQFNQKTQNCDWWYNVDCGGRLGSPEDFEQAAAASSQRSRVAPADATGMPAGESTPQSTGASTTTATATSSSTSNSQEQQQQIRTYSDSPPAETSSTVSYFVTGGSLTNSTLSGQANSEGDQQTTPRATTEQLDERQQADAVASSNSATTTTTNSYNDSTNNKDNGNNLIEVVAVTADSQPRVGAAPNEDLATTTMSSPNQTIQQLVATETVPVTTQANSAAGQQRQPQISQATQKELTKSRRLIQSEFGGSSKSARAISTAGMIESSTRQLKQLQQLTIGELTSLEGQLEEQLRQNHQSVRLGKSTLDAVGDQQSQDGAYSAGSNQGSVSYDPQILNSIGQLDEIQADQRQHNQPEQSPLSPTRRRGVVPETESAGEVAKEATKSEKSHVSKQIQPNPKLERRFGARLAPLVAQQVTAT